MLYLGLPRLLSKGWPGCILIWMFAWGRISFQAHSGCWQNSFSCSCVTEFSVGFSVCWLEAAPALEVLDSTILSHRRGVNKSSGIMEQWFSAFAVALIRNQSWVLFYLRESIHTGLIPHRSSTPKFSYSLRIVHKSWFLVLQQTFHFPLVLVGLCSLPRIKFYIFFGFLATSDRN